jgi:hypothetical protein
MAHRGSLKVMMMSLYGTRRTRSTSTDTSWISDAWHWWEHKSDCAAKKGMDKRRIGELKAQGAIRATVDHGILVDIMDLTSAKEMWDHSNHSMRIDPWNTRSKLRTSSGHSS